MNHSGASQTLAPLWRESKIIVRLTLPILIAQFAQTANGFVDTLMAGRVSPDDLAAVAVGSAIWVPIFLLIVGVMQGLIPFISQFHGAGHFRHIGATTQQGLWLAIPLGIGGFLLLNNTAPLLEFMAVSSDIQPLITAYLAGTAWGFPAITLFMALRAYTEGTSRTRPVMIVSLLGLALNIPVNYVLIYGKLGFPALGGVGCGWATSVVMWFMLSLMILYSFLLEKSLHTGLFQRWVSPDWSRLLAILKVGLPIGLAIFIEVSLFCVIALFVAQLGATAVASHQIALNASSLVFMIPLSLSIALTVRVGHNLGKENNEGVKCAARSGFIIILLLASVTSTSLALCNEQIARIYTQDLGIVQAAAVLLMFAAAFQLSDGLQVTASGILRGMKDTRYPMVLTLLVYWGLGLPVGYILGLTDWVVAPMGPRGFWIGLIVGLTTAAIFLCIRVKKRLNELPN